MNEFKPVITGVIGAGAISDAYLVNLTGQFSPYIHVVSVRRLGPFSVRLNGPILDQLKRPIHQ